MLARMRSFFVGVVSGAIVGSIVALILTPDSGKNLRRQTQAHLDAIKRESILAAEARRQALKEELAAKTALPTDEEAAQ